MTSKEKLVFIFSIFKFISHARKLSHDSFMHNSRPCEIHLLTARMHEQIKVLHKTLSEKFLSAQKSTGIVKYTLN